MHPPATADLTLCDRAVLLVLSELLPPDTPRELTIPQLARAGGFVPRHVSASLTALERAGLIVRLHAGPGCPPSILRPSTPLPAAAPSDAPLPAPLPQTDAPRPRSITDALCDLFRSHPRGTVLTTSTHDLAAAIGRPDDTQLRVVLGKLVWAGLIERLPGRELRLRLCGPFPASEGDAAPAPDSAERVLTQVRAALHGQPLGIELSITVKQLAAAIGRGQMSVVRALRTLEAEGTLRRTVVGRRTALILLAPLDVPPPSAPALCTPPPPTLPPAQRVTPHAALWQHLRASQRHRNPTDWLLSGLTVTVLTDTTVLTCVDAARTSFARCWHRTLASTLRALELPHTLVIREAPADVAPALPPGALDAALEARSVDGLLDALRPMPRLTEEQAHALLAQVQAGQAAQERQATLGEPSADLAQTQAWGSAAWERLILGYLRLIVSIARRHRSARLSEDELVQAGLLGLMQAVAGSDGRLTLPFELFAYRAAHRAIHQALAATRPIRCTSSQARVVQAQRQLAQRLGREPTVEEIAQQVRMRVSTVLAALEAEQGTASLDAPLREDTERTLGDTLADAQVLTPEDVLLAREAVQARQAVLGSALAGLEPDARRVIALRFGLEGEARGVREVAQALGWSVPRVQQVEAGALAALRKQLVSSEVDR